MSCSLVKPRKTALMFFLEDRIEQYKRKFLSVNYMHKMHNNVPFAKFRKKYTKQWEAMSHKDKFEYKLLELLDEERYENETLFIDSNSVSKVKQSKQDIRFFNPFAKKEHKNGDTISTGHTSKEFVYYPDRRSQTQTLQKKNKIKEKLNFENKYVSECNKVDNGSDIQSLNIRNCTQPNMELQQERQCTELYDSKIRHEICKEQSCRKQKIKYSLKCKSCVVEYKTIHALRDHYKIRHGIKNESNSSIGRSCLSFQNKEYSCSFCPFSSLRESTLEMHMIVHKQKPARNEANDAFKNNQTAKELYLPDAIEQTMEKQCSEKDYSESDSSHQMNLTKSFGKIDTEDKYTTYEKSPIANQIHIKSSTINSPISQFVEIIPQVNCLPFYCIKCHLRFRSKESEKFHAFVCLHSWFERDPSYKLVEQNVTSVEPKAFCCKKCYLEFNSKVALKYHVSVCQELRVTLDPSEEAKEVNFTLTEPILYCCPKCQLKFHSKEAKKYHVVVCLDIYPNTMSNVEKKLCNSPRVKQVPSKIEPDGLYEFSHINTKTYFEQLILEYIWQYIAKLEMTCQDQNTIIESGKRKTKESKKILSNFLPIPFCGNLIETNQSLVSHSNITVHQKALEFNAQTSVDMNYGIKQNYNALVTAPSDMLPSMPMLPLPLFDCKICGAILASNKGLKKHMKFTHVASKHICSFCTFSTSYKKNLETHNRKKHFFENLVI